MATIINSGQKKRIPREEDTTKGTTAGNFTGDLADAGSGRVGGGGLAGLGQVIASRIRDNAPVSTSIGADVGSNITGGTGTNIVSTGGANIQPNGGQPVQDIPTEELGTVLGEAPVSGDAQIIPGKETSTDDTLAAAIDEFISSLIAGNASAAEAAIANIRSEETTALAGEGAAQRQAEQAFLDQLEGIDKGVFDAEQIAKARSQRRGIASSQQGEALAQGIQREGLGLRFKNEQDRTNRLADITDRINAIKTSTAQRITGVGHEQAAADAAARAKGQEIGLQRSFQVEDREDVQAFELGRDAQNFERDLIKTGIVHANDLEKIDINFRNALYAAAQQNQWNLDRDAINNAAALSRLGVSNAHALNLMGLQQSHDLNMANLSFAQADKVADMQFERTKELAQLGENSQLRIMNASHGYSIDEMEARIKLDYTLENVLNFGPNTTKDQIVRDVFEDKKAGIGIIRFLTPKIFGWEDARVRNFTDDEINELIKKNETKVNNFLRGIGY